MFVIILALTILLEASLTTIPLTLVLLLIYAVYKNDLNVLFLGFFSGLFLDILRLETVGITSLYFVIFLSLVLMYKRKFETESVYYLLFFCFLGVLLFSFLNGLGNPIAQAILSTALALLIYKTFVPAKERILPWQQK
ncbi:MAG: hypothetical protein AAB801_01610 [Patescibacteria group bacterium]